MNKVKNKRLIFSILACIVFISIGLAIAYSLNWFSIGADVASQQRLTIPNGYILSNTYLQLVNESSTPTIVTATDIRTDAQKRDTQRKADLNNLKSAIDEFSKQTIDSKTKGLPVSDGWIATKDIAKANDSLAETLLPTKVMTNIPCDPQNTAKDCTSGITYQYWRHDYSGIGGTNKEYSLYTKLESPTATDLATMNTGNAKMNAKAKTYGMNYRVGN